MHVFWVKVQTLVATISKHHYVIWMYQPVSSLSGVVVITSAASVKIHWYTPASDRAKLVILSSLDLWTTTVPSVMVMLPPLTTCSPFLTHTTEGGLELPVPTQLNTWVLPADTAVRLSTGKLSLSVGLVTTVSVLVLAGEKETQHQGIWTSDYTYENFLCLLTTYNTCKLHHVLHTCNYHYSVWHEATQHWTMVTYLFFIDPMQSQPATLTYERQSGASCS